MLIVSMHLIYNLPNLLISSFLLVMPVSSEAFNDKLNTADIKEYII